MDVGLGPIIRYHRDRPRPLAEVYDEFFDELILGAAGRAGLYGSCIGSNI